MAIRVIWVICQPGMPPVTASPAGLEAPGRGGLTVGVLRGAVDEPAGLERPPLVAAGT
jgi:hypothetical protein